MNEIKEITITKKEAVKTLGNFIKFFEWMNENHPEVFYEYLNLNGGKF